MRITKTVTFNYQTTTVFFSSPGILTQGVSPCLEDWKILFVKLHEFTLNATFELIKMLSAKQPYYMFTSNHDTELSCSTEHSIAMFPFPKLPKSGINQCSNFPSNACLPVFPFILLPRQIIAEYKTGLFSTKNIGKTVYPYAMKLDP